MYLCFHTECRGLLRKIGVGPVVTFHSRCMMPEWVIGQALPGFNILCWVCFSRIVKMYSAGIGSVQTNVVGSSLQKYHITLKSISDMFSEIKEREGVTHWKLTMLSYAPAIFLALESIDTFGMHVRTHA